MSSLSGRVSPRRRAGSGTTQGIRRILLSARISGQREHRGEIVAPGRVARNHHPRADDDAAGEAPRSRAADEPLRPPLPPDPGPALQPVRQPICSRRPRADGTRRYVCSSQIGGCGKVTVLADPGRVRRHAGGLGTVGVPASAAGDHPRPRRHGRLRVADQAANAAQAQLDELAEMWASGEITRGEWQTARPPIEARLSTGPKEARPSQPLSRDAPFMVTRCASGRVGDHDVEPSGADRARPRRLHRRPPSPPGYNRFDPERLDLHLARLTRPGSARGSRAARTHSATRRDPSP